MTVADWKRETQMNHGKALDPNDILTPQELAGRLKVSVSWIYEKARARGQYQGEPLPCLRVGRYLRFSWPEIVEWLHSSEK
jgi:hypothetical protein